MDRPDLPSPASLHDIYMHDQCLSLRAIVDLLVPKQPAPQADAPVELREPEKPKPQHRDQMLEYETTAVEDPPPARPEMTGAVQVEQPLQRKAQQGPTRPAEPVVPRRQAKE